MLLLFLLLHVCYNYIDLQGNATVPDHLKGLDRLVDPDAPGSGLVQQLEL
jgi:hypothetical protein